MAKQVNPRKKKLDAISTKIATFLVSETYTDEQDAQGWLSEAIKCLDKAVEILVKNDEKQEAVGVGSSAEKPDTCEGAVFAGNIGA
jgi:hypothetical protein